jgi:hypothetical protein
MKIEAKDNQSLIDIAVQITGSAAGAFELALQNDISITDAMTVSQPLETVLIENKDIEKFYTKNGLIPATAATENEVPGGINFMGIEIDFIVS